VAARLAQQSRPQFIFSNPPFAYSHPTLERLQMMLILLAMLAAALAPVRGRNIEAPIRFDNDAFVDDNHSQASLVFSLGSVSPSTTRTSNPAPDEAPTHAASDRRRRNQMSTSGE
jgi:hypothetical protein